MGEKDFSFALTELNKGNSVYSKSWDGITSKEMFITKQISDENSKMTVSYLYMTIIEKNKPTIVVPRTPSQTDLRMNDWVVKR